MQIKIYTIPLLGGENVVDEMNGFLRAHRIVDVRKELTSSPAGTFWTFCITYLLGENGEYDRKGKIDYKQVLDASAFERFSQMRVIRKQLAIADAVPAYSVFTDAELAEFSKQPKLTLIDMKKVDGVGEKRLEKYGEKFLELLQLSDETSGVSDGANSEQREFVSGVF